MDTFYQELIGRVLQLCSPNLLVVIDLLYCAWRGLVHILNKAAMKRSYDLLLDTSWRVSDDRVYVDR